MCACLLTCVQLLRASDSVSRRVFVPRCYPVGASSSGWSSMDSERCTPHLPLPLPAARMRACTALLSSGAASHNGCCTMLVAQCLLPRAASHGSCFRSDGEGGGGTSFSRSRALALAPAPAPAPAPQASEQGGSLAFGIGCTFRRDSRGRYRVKRVIKGGAAHAAHAVLSGACAAMQLLPLLACVTCDV